MTRNTIIMAAMLVVSLLAGAGCDTKACLDLAELRCELCDQDSDSSKDRCTCIEQGSLSQSNADQEFENDDEAGMWCDDYLFDTKRSGADQGASCRAEVELYEKYREKVCDGVEWDEGDDDDDYYGDDDDYYGDDDDYYGDDDDYYGDDDDDTGD